MPARQLPPPEPAVRQRALAAFSLGLLSLIGLMLGLGNLRRGIVVAVVTLVFGLVAIWLGVSSNRTARRTGTARPRWAVGGVVLWPQLNTYYNCMAGANTVATQQACHDQFTKSVGGEMSVLQGGRLPARRAVGE
jgi:hypothetical protein